MGTTLDSLKPPAGAKHKRKRVGRGRGSGNGTTAGRGVKGQGSRSGVQRIKGWFEGGQMPLQRRLPKRGFKNPFRLAYDAVNVGRLAEAFAAGEVADPEALRARGLVPRRSERMKVLGEGDVEHAVTVKAHAFSKAAVEKIQAAGGSVEVLEDRRRRKAAAPRQLSESPTAEVES